MGGVRGGSVMCDDDSYFLQSYSDSDNRTYVLVVLTTELRLRTSLRS